MDELEELLVDAIKTSPRHQGYEEARNMYPDIELKFCNGCKKWLPIHAYNSRNDRGSADKHGKLSKCRICLAAKARVYYRENIEYLQREGRKREYLRRHKGRITEEEVELLLDNRRGPCEVCHQEAELMLDHCHTTGKRRGFLCRDCNFAAGIVKDSIATLESLIAYLKKYR